MAAKRKVIDPWRVAAEKAPTEEPKLKDKFDPDADFEPRHAVQFRGKNCGINVWLEWVPDDSQRDAANSDALEQLNALLCDLFAEGHSSILEKNGVYKESPPEEKTFLFRGHETFHLRYSDVHAPSTMGAVTTLCYALRALQNANPEAAKQIKSRFVKPYIA
jgi:hypothetical protein